SAMANTISVHGHGFITGESVRYTTNGEDITGLTSGSIYYVIVVDANTVKLAQNVDDAYAGNTLTLDPSTATDTAALTPTTTNLTPVSFNASPVRAAGSTFTLPAHGFATAEAVTYTAGGTPIGGLTSGATYYVIVVDS